MKKKNVINTINEEFNLNESDDEYDNDKSNQFYENQNYVLNGFLIFWI